MLVRYFVNQHVLSISGNLMCGALMTFDFEDGVEEEVILWALLEEIVILKMLEEVIL